MNIRRIHAKVETINCLLPFSQAFNAFDIESLGELTLYFSTGLGVCPILWCLLSSGLFASPVLAGMQRIGGLDGQSITSQLFGKLG